MVSLRRKALIDSDLLVGEHPGLPRDSGEAL
jgi:hypothetical protein